MLTSFYFKAEVNSGLASRASWWSPPALGGVSVGDRFDVRVGTVVPHRDKDAGQLSPYLRARELPIDGEYKPGNVQRRHEGKRFRPPFVVVRRTSRPDASAPSRLAPTLIRGKEPVLVENHLIVCAPRDRKLASCEDLIEALTARTTTKWLDQRLRCRHLTVTAIRDVPLPDGTSN